MLSAHACRLSHKFYLSTNYQITAQQAAKQAVDAVSKYKSPGPTLVTLVDR